jgi:hypothetical protein
MGYADHTARTRGVVVASARVPSKENSHTKSSPTVPTAAMSMRPSTSIPWLRAGRSRRSNPTTSATYEATQKTSATETSGGVRPLRT